MGRKRRSRGKKRANWSRSTQRLQDNQRIMSRARVSPPRCPPGKVATMCNVPANQGAHLPSSSHHGHAGEVRTTQRRAEAQRMGPKSVRAAVKRREDRAGDSLVVGRRVKEWAGDGGLPGGKVRP